MITSGIKRNYRFLKCFARKRSPEIRLNAEYRHDLRSCELTDRQSGQNPQPLYLCNHLTYISAACGSANNIANNALDVGVIFLELGNSISDSGTSNLA